MPAASAPQAPGRTTSPGILRRKVVYVSDLLGAHDYRILSRMRANGHTVTLVTCIADIDRKNFEVSGYDVRRIPGLDIRHRVDLAGGRGWALLARRTAFLRAVLREVNPDVLYAGWVQTSGLISVLSGFHPLLMMPYGSDVLLEPYTTRRARWLASAILRRADLVTVDADVMKEAILSYTGLPSEKVVMVPWGADLDRYGLDYDAEACKRSMGWSGRKVVLKNRTLRPVYGYPEFLKAMAVVAKSVPELLVVICSDGPQETELRALAATLGIAEKCVWTGYTDAETFRTALRACDVYVNAAHSDGASVSLQEAIASAKAMVVSDIQAPRQFLVPEENALFFGLGDADALAAQTLRILSDRGLQSRLETALRGYDRSVIDGDRRIDQILALFDGLVRA